jgi:hypothetical protein
MTNNNARTMPQIPFGDCHERIGAKQDDKKFRGLIPEEVLLFLRFLVL